MTLVAAMIAAADVGRHALVDRDKSGTMVGCREKVSSQVTNAHVSASSRSFAAERTEFVPQFAKT
jgi:hypothetical protein